MKKKRKKNIGKRNNRKRKQIIIPDKIHEIISYLSTSFSNKLLEKEDIKQDLYLLYLEMLKKDKRAKKAVPGYFFIKFVWFLKTKYKREVTRKIKEWEYALKNDPDKFRRQSRIGYLVSTKLFKKRKRQNS